MEYIRHLFPDPVIKEEDFENYKRARGLYIADPWERVKCIFRLEWVVSLILLFILFRGQIPTILYWRTLHEQRISYYNLHPELLRASNFAQMGIIFGGGLAGIYESVQYSKNFTRTNDLNVYRNKKDLYRSLSNKSMQGMGWGFIKWGPKVGLFAGGFSLLSSCCEAYRNKSGVIEYVIGGYLMGGFSKSAFGLKGFIAGGIIGALLGLTYGSVRVAFQKLTKTDALVLKYSQYALVQHRKQLIAESVRNTKPTASEKFMLSVHGKHVPNPLVNFDEREQLEN